MVIFYHLEENNVHLHTLPTCHSSKACVCACFPLSREDGSCYPTRVPLGLAGGPTS